MNSVPDSVLKQRMLCREKEWVCITFIIVFMISPIYLFIIYSNFSYWMIDDIHKHYIHNKNKQDIRTESGVTNNNNG